MKRTLLFTALALPLLAIGCRQEPLPPEAADPYVDHRATDVQSPPSPGAEAAPALPQTERPAEPSG